MAYTCELETGRRVIKNKEEAKKVISVTATLWELTRYEVLNYKKFKDISRVFGIDLTDIKQTVVENNAEYSYEYVWEK